MVMRDGIPWFRPPDRLDPDRRLRRNTFHQTVDAARRTGLRWRTPVTDGRDGPDATDGAARAAPEHEPP